MKPVITIVVNEERGEKEEFTNFVKRMIKKYLIQNTNFIQIEIKDVKYKDAQEWHKAMGKVGNIEPSREYVVELREQIVKGVDV